MEDEDGKDAGGEEVNDLAHDLTPGLACQIAADRAGTALQEYDPLDAFMAGIESEVKANKPSKAKKKLERDEEEDNVADYMEVSSVFTHPGFI
eukprot:scaffold139539_cov24-Prasinocladus_malaysianus.AAC.2